MHYYRRNIRDYLVDTRDLSIEEHGLYNLLIDEYYLQESAINLKTFEEKYKIRSKKMKSSLKKIFFNFFYTNDNENFFQKRIEDEIKSYRAKSKKNTKNGKLGGEAKARNSSERYQDFEKSGTENLANHKPLTMNHEPLTMNHEPLTMNHEPLTMNHSELTKVNSNVQNQDLAPQTKKNYSKDFERFWKTYPKGINENGTERSWSSCKRETFEIWNELFDFGIDSEFLIEQAAKYKIANNQREGGKYTYSPKKYLADKIFKIDTYHAENAKPSNLPQDRRSQVTLDNEAYIEKYFNDGQNTKPEGHIYDNE